MDDTFYLTEASVRMSEVCPPCARPDPREVAILLVGEETLLKLEANGLSVECPYWPEARKVVDDAKTEGRVVKRDLLDIDIPGIDRTWTFFMRAKEILGTK